MNLSHKGMTLPELLVTLGISSIISLGVAKAFQLYSQITSEVTIRGEMENFRNLIRPHVDCNKPCAGLGSELFDRLNGGLLSKSKLLVSANCMPTDANPMVSPHSTPENPNPLDRYPFTGTPIAGPLFSLDSGWLCKSRRDKSCLAGCHTSSPLLDRGFYAPPLSMGTRTTEIECYAGYAIGVDFSVARAICASPVHDIVDGCVTLEKISKDMNFQQTDSPKGTVKIQISGTSPCSGFSQYRARDINLEKVILDVDLINDFLPTSTMIFSIIKSENPIQGMFYNASRTYTVPEGIFDVEYQEKEVILKNFRKE